MVDFVDSLADVSVTDAQWQEIVERLLPIKDEHKGNIRQKMLNKREAIDAMYRNDQRCAPWTGTALGAFQAFNTHELHIAGPDRNRFDRNFSRVISRIGEKRDVSTIDVILTVARR